MLASWPVGYPWTSRFGRIGLGKAFLCEGPFIALLCLRACHADESLLVVLQVGELSAEMASFVGLVLARELAEGARGSRRSTLSLCLCVNNLVGGLVKQTI